MKYTVTIWRYENSSVPEIWSWAERDDLLEAVFTVMARFGVHSAWRVQVETAPGVTVAEFTCLSLLSEPPA